MKRTTIFAEEALFREVKEISNEEHRSIADINPLSFVSVGKSGKKNIADQHEELLWKKT